MVTCLPPLWTMASIRCPRSMPMDSMSAPSASLMRSPLRARSEISEWSFEDPFDLAVSVEARECRQPSGDGRAHLPFGVDRAAEDLEMRLAAAPSATCVTHTVPSLSCLPLAAEGLGALP